MASDGGSTAADPTGIHGRTTPLWYLQVSYDVMIMMMSSYDVIFV